MNKDCYRVIFSRALQRQVVVAEHTSVGRGAAARRVGPAAGLLGLLLVGVVQAEIVADRSAPARQQPTVLTTASGLPQVNIQTPSAAGVSRNTYSQFDVGPQGAILNNSRVDVQTQMGGWVTANPWLAQGPARVILNEVNSAAPSLLQGYIEVAGPRAQVVVANPAGISCSGCGFINASRSTLTTGSPVMNSGNLESFLVQRGTITIEGLGMDATRSDYSDVIARAVQVNAGLWAQRLNVVTGAVQVAAAAGAADPVPLGLAEAQGLAPRYAVDVSALGGMYAGKIHLVGTEAGVGVVNAGSIGAGVGDVVIAADGQLSNSGSINAAMSLDVTTGKNLVNSGSFYAKSNLSVAASGDIANQSIMAAGQGVSLWSESRIDNAPDALLAAGLDERGYMQYPGTLQIGAGESFTNRGLIDGGEVRLAAGNTLLNTGSGRIYGDHLAIQAGTLLNTDESVDGVTGAAVIAARQRLDIGVVRLSNEGDALIFSGGAMAIAGALDENGLATGRAETVDNTGSVIEAMGSLSLSAAALNNRNAAFSTEVVAVGTPQSLFRLDPADDGSSNLYDISNFERYSWSRTYKYRWKTAAADAPPLPVPGKTALPQVGETEDCGTEPCALLPTADYAATSAAWDYFQLVPPTPEPAAPLMAEPVPPALPATDPGYAAAWTSYDSDKAAYDTAWTNYNSSHAGWQAATDTAYAELDDRIEAYNAQFTGGGNFNKWTEYHLTQADSETRVTSSDPAKLLAGGDMILRGDQLVNDKSQIIAGGLMYGDLGSLDNIQAEGVHVVHQEGTSQYTDTRWRGGTKRYYQRRWYGEAPYQPADQLSTITLAVTRLQANTAPTERESGQAVLPTPTIQLPDNALFSQHPAVNSHVLVETDPRFANYRQWLSSDYLLNALSFDPARTQKRLGDGFYEQKLLREQVAQLTGQRFLEGYASDEEQYRALMNNAVTFAKAYGLRPGLALTPAQMAALTSDIVWLVEENVTLPDGSQQKVLAPRLYMKTRVGDLQGDGTLIAAEDMDIRMKGNFQNSGTVAGRQLMSITAENIRNLGGHIEAASLSLAARNDLDNLGGVLKAQDSARVTAGHDLNMASTTYTTANTVGDSSFSRTALDRLAGLYVSSPAGRLTLAAGHDIALTAAQVVNAGNGGAALSAANALRLEAVNVGEQNKSVANAGNYNRQGHTQDIGSQVSSRGSISLSGRSIEAEAARISSQQGGVVLQAEESLQIKEGRATTNSDVRHQHTDKGLTESASYAERDAYRSDEAVGSRIEGKTVALKGRDVAVQGSEVVSDEGTLVQGTKSVAITHAENHYSALHEQETRKIGILSGGLGLITPLALLKDPLVIGKSKTEAKQSQESTSSAGSTVGAIQGNVLIQSGGTYAQTGSSIIAGTGVDAEGKPRLLAAGNASAGNVVIAAKRVEISDAQESIDSLQSSKSKTTALTVTMNTPAVDAVKGIQAQRKAATETDSSRMKALAVANELMQGGTALSAMGAGSPAGIDPAKAASVTVMATAGVQRSQSRSEQHGRSSAGSQVSGNNVVISATGGGDESDIVIRGSEVRAAHSASLKADDAIQALAGKNTHSQTGSSTSSGGGLGVGATLSASQGVGMGVAVTGNAARSQENGQGTVWSNSHIAAGEKLQVESVGDTDIAGAVLSAPQVTGTIGGHLNIRNLQDSTTYESKGRNASGTAIVGVGTSVSGSVGMNDAESDYLSVGEKSGIKAGDGGFQLAVKGKTTLVGAEISSTEAAVAKGLNKFLSDGGIELQDLHNHAEYKANGIQVSAAGNSGAASGSGDGKANNSNNTAFKPNSVGFGSDDGNASSVTTAGISDMAGDAGVRSDKDTTNTLKPIFDPEKVQKEIAAQTLITAEFGRQAPKAVADYAGKQRDALQQRAKQEQDPGKREALLKEAGRWDEGGVYRVAAHTVLGALGSGNAGAAAVTVTTAAAAPLLDEAEIRISNTLVAAGLSPEAARAAANSVLFGTVALAGAAGGGVAGTGMAVNIDANNRQLHPVEYKLINRKAQELYAEHKNDLYRPAEQNTPEYWTQLLTQEGLAQVDYASRDGRRAALQAMGKAANNPQSEGYMSGGAQRYIDDSQLAMDAVIGMKGTVLESDKIYGTITSFSATEAQARNPILYGRGGDTPGYSSLPDRNRAQSQNAKATASLEDFQLQASERLSAQNGSTDYVPILEEVMLGGVEGRIADDIFDASKAAVTGAKNFAREVAEKRAINKAEEEAINSARLNNNFYSDGVALDFPRELKTKSGRLITANPDKTTTILGSFGADTDRIINLELGLPKSMVIQGRVRPGSFNVLNTPNGLYEALGAEKFWEEVNKPFLDSAIRRGDDIVLATAPEGKYLDRLSPDGSGRVERTGFGREYDYLLKNGYFYDSATGVMKK